MQGIRDLAGVHADELCDVLDNPGTSLDPFDYIRL